MKMNQMLFLLAAGLLVGIGALASFGHSQAPKKPNDVADFMRLKLGHSQNVLEGIVVEDFDMIAKNSQALGLLAQDANWRVYQTPEYRHHSADFQRVTDALTQAAKDRNIDGAALAYVQLTMSCVNCHKYTRGVRMASLDDAFGTLPAAAPIR